MARLAGSIDGVIGVDTHRDTLAAAVIDPIGGVLAQTSVDADAAGYRQLLDFGVVRVPGRRCWAVEGAGSYGAGLTVLLRAHGERVVEVGRPQRPPRRSGAKSDALDAIRAAREALAQDHVLVPRQRGDREAMRVLLATRHSACAAKVCAINQLKALVVGAPEELRAELRGLATKRQIGRCARLRDRPARSMEHRMTVRALRSTAQRIQLLAAEAAGLRAELERLVAAVTPWLLELPGVGPISAAQVLVSWSHAGRLRSEAAFAALAGVNPIPASSGQVTRHRLNRSGDRQLNRALHTIVVARLRDDPQTRIYAARRQAEGKSVVMSVGASSGWSPATCSNCWSATTARRWNWRTAHSQVCPLVVLSCSEQSWRSRDHSCREVRVVGKEIGGALIRRRSPVIAPSGTPRPRWPCHGAITHRRRGLLIAVLVCLLAAACTSPDSRQATATSQGPAGPTQRDYWPTAGWRTAAPKDQGMDPALVGELDARISGSYPQVRSLLVVRHGYLVYERYWHGLDASDGHNSFSVTKSFTSALVGIALEAGHLRGLDQTVGDLLDAHLPPNADPRLRRVTVQQLLTMTAGLAGDDPSGAWIGMLQSRNWLRYILGRRLVSNPGAEFAYSSASSHLLSAIVTDATGQATLDYARAKLFGPLGIATDHALVQPIRTWPPTPAQLQAYEQAPVAWATDPQGYQIGYSWLKLPARDLAKFGYLYLNGGRWDGRQVVPADYVRASTQPQSKPPPSDPADGYGYQWWTTSVDSHRSFFAAGFAGQLIQVIPDLDLVVVLTSDIDQERSDAGNLVAEAIVPAIVD